MEGRILGCSLSIIWTIFKMTPNLLWIWSFYSFQHTWSYKKDFVLLRRKKLWHNIYEMLEEVTNNVRIDVTAVNRGIITYWGNWSMDARANIRVRGFSCRRQMIFSNAKIFDPNAQRHENEINKKWDATKQMNKKRK